MPKQGKGRSNYRLDPTGVIAAKGYGKGMYSHVRVLWDATAEGDLGYAELDLQISHDDVTNFVFGLNKGTTPDRFA